MAHAQQVEVVFPYEAADRNQLSLTVGERITVVQRNEPGGWWIGQNVRNEMGIFPSAYCQEVKEKPRFAVPQEQKTGELKTLTDSGRVDSGGSVGPKPCLKSNRSFTASSSALSQRSKLSDLGFDAGEFAPQSTAGITNLTIVRRQLAAVEADRKKLQAKRKVLETQARDTDFSVGDIEAELSRAKEELRLVLVRLEAVQHDTELLNAVFMDEPSPAGAAKAPGDSTTPVEPGGGTRPGSAAEEAFASAMGGGEELDDSELDDRARKYIRKFQKRIDEAMAVKADYDKQQRKLEKKRAKIDASFAQAEARLAELRSEEARRASAAAAASASAAEATEKELEAIAKEQAEVDAAIAAVTKDISKLKKKLKRGQEATDDLRTKHQDLLAWKEKTLAKLQARAEAERASAAAIADLESQLDVAKADAAAAEKRKEAAVAAARGRVVQEEQRIAALRAQLAELKAKLGLPP